MIARTLALLGLVCAATVARPDDDDDLRTRLIVRLKPGVSPILLAAKYGLAYRDGAWPFALLQGDTPIETEDAQALLNQDPGVVWAEDDDQSESPENTGGGRGGTIPTIASDPVLQQLNQAALKQVGYPSGAFLGWNAGRTIRVAVLDTGLSSSVSALTSRVVKWANTVDGGNAFDRPRGQDTNGDSRVDGNVGHGTMVLGLIAQVAPAARFIVIRAMDSDGMGTAWSLTKGLVVAVNQGAEIANLSLGSRKKIPAMSDVLDWAVEEKGLHVVAAAGNAQLSQAFSPADSSKTISVAGLDPNDRKATFSNWDSGLDLCVPALSIKSYNTNARIATWSGTSFATPIATGGIAYALAQTKKKVTPDQMMASLRATSLSVDTKNPLYKGKIGRKLRIGSLADYLKARY